MSYAPVAITQVGLSVRYEVCPNAMVGDGSVYCNCPKDPEDNPTPPHPLLDYSIQPYTQAALVAPLAAGATALMVNDGRSFAPGEAIALIDEAEEQVSIAAGYVAPVTAGPASIPLSAPTTQAHDAGTPLSNWKPPTEIGGASTAGMPIVLAWLKLHGLEAALKVKADIEGLPSGPLPGGLTAAALGVAV